MNQFTKFPSIESFAHVFRGQQRFDKPARVEYGAKVKIHGTNAAVRINPDGTFAAQSRSRDITPEADNAGFAAWVHANAGNWEYTISRIVADEYLSAEPMVIFGEWAGSGVQKGDAVCGLNEKYFFVFAVEYAGMFFTDPDFIEVVCPDLDNLMVLPWNNLYTGVVDFYDSEACQEFIYGVSRTVSEIGERDPFIYGIFGVDGPGEGLVVMPVGHPENVSATSMGPDKAIFKDVFSALTFKAKTLAHSVKKTGVPSVHVEIPENVSTFVDMFVTDARCEQALEEACGGVAAPQNTGAFLKWVMSDIHKESAVELEDSGIEWKEVVKPLTKAIKKWYVEACERVGT